MQVAPVPPPIGPLDSIKICFKNYVQFSGRGRRSEFWYFYCLCVIIMVVVTCCQYAFISYEVYDGYYYRTYTPVYSSGYYVYVVFYLIVDLALFIPLLAASTRRLHDTGRSGLFFLITFIPCGIFALWYFWSIDSVPGANIYGPATKYQLAQTNPLLVAQPNVVVVSPGVQPVAYPNVQPNVYPGQQPIMANPNMQNIPSANPNSGGYPGQQNVPVAQPNNYVDKPVDQQQAQFNPMQGQTPAVPPPQNPPNY